MDSLYELRQLNFQYQLGTQKVRALNSVDLNIAPGDLHLLVGPSGSGKSTLLNLLGLVETPQEGQLLFRGQDIKALSESAKNQIRLFQIGYVFQSFLLFDVLTASENVEYFLVQQGIAKDLRKARVAEALNAVGLKDHAQKRPLEMSGGQRQRVAIARALAKKPAVIIADEPTASLDQKTSREIMELLQNLSHDGLSVIMSSHDPLSLDYCDSTTQIVDGSIVKASPRVSKAI